MEFWTGLFSMNNAIFLYFGQHNMKIGGTYAPRVKGVEGQGQGVLFFRSLSMNSRNVRDGVPFEKEAVKSFQISYFLIRFGFLQKWSCGPSINGDIR
jgi:hypothetical protein